MGRLFGTDGVRGIANKDLSPQLAFQLGQAGARVLAEECGTKPQILIGKDSRISSDLLEAALAAGICSVGANAISLGVLPTPAVAHLTRFYNADAGVMISASHNPMEYNGIKFFDCDGYKLSDDVEDRIEKLVRCEEIQNLPTGGDVGTIIHIDSAKQDYTNFAKKTIDTDLSGLKIALDCANGAISSIAPEVFESLGAEIFVINNEPNGININDKCGSTHLEALSELVETVNADFGVAFDGDADRLLAVDEHGVLVDGDKIMAICGNELKKQGKLKDNVIVATVMSNLGLFIMGRDQGIDILQTNVGDRYVLEKMVECGYTLGGEQSGHIIFLNHNTTGDGLVTALQLAAIIKKNGNKLSDLTEIMSSLPQVLVNAKVENNQKPLLNTNSDIIQAIGSIEKKFEGNGRVLIRPSGTEPLVRVMIEGKDVDSIKRDAEYLANFIEKTLA